MILLWQYSILHLQYEDCDFAFMNSHKRNVAYIDGANLHKASQYLGWDFDYARFRIWLFDKYSVKQAYIFLGMVPEFKSLYSYLKSCGYILIFKEVVYSKLGNIKGNCDTDIVVRAMQDAYENRFDNVVLVSSDGDYAPLITFLIMRNKMEIILSPYNTKKCSILLQKFCKDHL